MISVDRPTFDFCEGNNDVSKCGCYFAVHDSMQNCVQIHNFKNIANFHKDFERWDLITVSSIAENVPGKVAFTGDRNFVVCATHNGHIYMLPNRVKFRIRKKTSSLNNKVPNFLDLQFKDNETVVALSLVPNDKFMLVCSQTTLSFVSPTLKVMLQVGTTDLNIKGKHWCLGNLSG